MSWTFLSDTTPIGRKTHWCILCDGMIQMGVRHVARRGISDGVPVTIRLHTECEAATKGWTTDDWEYNEPSEFRRKCLPQ